MAEGLFIFNDAVILSPGGSIVGFSQPWAQKTTWTRRQDRVSRMDQDGEFLSPNTLDDAGVSTDVEVVALAQAYHFDITGYSKPIGGTNGIGARITSNGGVFADVYADGSSMRIRVRDVIDGDYNTLITQRWRLLDRRYSDSLLKIKMRITGVQVQVKVWMDFEPEPAKWDVYTETSIQNSGRVGIAPEGRAVQEYLWFGYSTTERPAPQGPDGLITEDHADFRGLVPLAVSMSWPLYGDGTTVDPRAICHAREDQDAATLGFRSARARALKIATKNNNEVPPPGDLPRGYAHCSRFSGTLIVNTIDPRMSAELTDWQNQYVEDPRNGWVQVGCGEHYRPQDYRPGDLWITRNPGHVFVWIGEYGGYPDVIAQASFMGVESSKARVGHLIRYPLDKTTGLDGPGRPYSAWRFVGRKPNVAHYQSYDELKQVDLRMQTENGIERFNG